MKRMNDRIELTRILARIASLTDSVCPEAAHLAWEAYEIVNPKTNPDAPSKIRATLSTYAKGTARDLAKRLDAFAAEDK